MAKRNILLLLIGLFLWIFSNIIFYPSIVNVVVHQNYPVFLNAFFFFFQYLFIGLIMGVFGDKKGWMLGLMLGVLIFLIFIILQITSPLEAEGLKVNIVDSLFLILQSHLLFTIYLVIGGYLGETARKKIFMRKGP